MLRKISEAEYEKIGSISEWTPVPDIANYYGVSNGAIYAILKEIGATTYVQAAKIRRNQAVQEIVETEKAYRSLIQRDHGV